MKKFAQVVQSRENQKKKLRNIGYWMKMLPFLWMGILPFPFGGCSSFPPQSPASELQADAILQVHDSWYVFRWGSQRYLRLSQAEIPTQKRMANADQWLKIASPSGIFRPVAGLSAWPLSSGHFYLLDAGENRICLFDAEARLLSTFPLPKELIPQSTNRLEFFRGQGAFTFLNPLTGEAWQFAERQEGNAGSTDWILRNRTKLPMGIQDCFQDPSGYALFCRKDQNPLQFDASLNQVFGALTNQEVYRMHWDTKQKAWKLSVGKVDTLPDFEFWPSRHQLTPKDIIAP